MVIYDNIWQYFLTMRHIIKLHHVFDDMNGDLNETRKHEWQTNSICREILCSILFYENYKNSSKWHRLDASGSFRNPDSGCQCINMYTLMTQHIIVVMLYKSCRILFGETWYFISIICSTYMIHCITAFSAMIYVNSCSKMSYFL